MSAAFSRGRIAWAAGLAMLFAGLRWGSNFDGLYGQDAHEYLRYASALRAWLTSGDDPGFSRWPPGYPAAVALLSLVGFDIARSAQLVAALSWLAAFWFGASALGRLHPSKRVVSYWAVFFSLSPFLMRVGFSAMSDITAIAWECVFVALGLRWLDTGRAVDLGVSFLSFGLAAATRLSAPLVLGPLSAWFLLTALRRREGKALAAALLGAALPLVLAWHGSSVQVLALSNAEEWSPLNFLARRFVTASGGEHTFVLPNILASLAPLVHPGFCFLGPGLLFALRREDLETRVARSMLVGWLLFAGFLSGMALQNDRHHLASFPIAMLLLFPAYDRLIHFLSVAASGSRLPASAVVAAVIVVQVGLLGLASRTLLAGQALELRIASGLRKYPPVHLFAFGFSQGLSNRGVPQTVTDLFDTGPGVPRVGDFVLFAPDRLARQWGGQPLMRTFEALRPRLSKPLEAFGEGWFLYRVEAPAGSENR